MAHFPMFPVGNPELQRGDIAATKGRSRNAQ
jgi:hypothetical protein